MCDHHKHNHTHTDGCCCGHEHEHHHEHSCCEHKHEHHHEHHHESCGCGHDHNHEPEHGELPKLLIGAGLFAIGLLLKISAAPAWLAIATLAAAYLWLGGNVLLSAGRNIVRGHIFDENFLMSIATLGAFAIQEYPEAVGVMLFYRIGEYFEDKACAQSRKQIMQAVDMRPDVVNRLTAAQSDQSEEIPAAAAAVGDLLLIRPGDRIPLDGVIVNGSGRLDTSALTGEPKPRHVQPGSKVLSGCLNINGRLILQVEKPLAESMVTRILQSVENAAETKPQIDRFITRFARVYTPVVVVLALLPPLLFKASFAYWLKTALTFLVISCPCALVLSVPLAYFAGIGAASAKGILFKSGLAMENIGRLKAVAFDKTGTLTLGQFAVQTVLPAADISADELLATAAACEAASTHPIAASITAAANAAGLKHLPADNIQELAGMGITAKINGQNVLCGNHRLMQQFDINLDACHEYEAATEVLIAINGKFCGQIIIADTIKDDTPKAVAELKQQGLHVCMLTGDAEYTAAAVAEAIGVDEVHARLLPDDKLAALAEIRQRRGAVMFVGDGINDAPVLAGADIGAAMGSGADAAIEAADVVFMNSNTTAVPGAISIARAANRIARQNVVFALTIKAAIMLVGLCGHANMWLAVFADTGVAMLCLLNSVKILHRK